MPKPIPPPEPRVNWRLWMRVGVWACVFACVAFASKEVESYLKRDPEFALQTLEISGSRFTSRARIQAVFGADAGKSVFQIPRRLSESSGCLSFS